MASLGPGLTVFDEVHFVPALFQSLRVAVDERRRQGHRSGQFLVLGLASLDLVQSASSHSRDDWKSSNWRCSR
ncbi:MAG: hypothetical protein IPP28_00235 [Xanthomonadales bacterium]|nr:hypothetical protein [Xanthomonadales bacterium]